jgi:hypothetical protein
MRVFAVSPSGRPKKRRSSPWGGPARGSCPQPPVSWASLRARLALARTSLSRPRSARRSA